MRWDEKTNQKKDFTYAPPLPASPIPFPPTRRYDSLDSATNGRSDLDSASGSSRRTSRQYSLDSRHSLSDRWVSVAPTPPLSSTFSSCSSSCSSLWFPLWWCRGIGLVWSCGPRYACHACAPILLLHTWSIDIYIFIPLCICIYVLYHDYCEPVDDLSRIIR